MSGGEFAAIEEKWLQQCGPCDGGLPMSCTHPTEDYRPVISDLLAAVRERDSIIAKVHELMQSWDNGDYDDMNQFSPHHFVRHLRAALEPQEKR